MAEPMKLDRETNALVQRNNDLADMVKSAGWSIAKGMMMDRIAELGNILTISKEIQDSAILSLELRARQNAVQTLLSFLRDVEGQVELHKTQEEIMRIPLEKSWVNFIE